MQVAFFLPDEELQETVHTAYRRICGEYSSRSSSSFQYKVYIGRQVEDFPLEAFSCDCLVAGGSLYNSIQRSHTGKILIELALYSQHILAAMGRIKKENPECRLALVATEGVLNNARGLGERMGMKVGYYSTAQYSGNYYAKLVREVKRCNYTHLAGDPHICAYAQKAGIETTELLPDMQSFCQAFLTAFEWADAMGYQDNTVIQISALMDQVAEGVIYTDSEGFIVRMNETAKKLLHIDGEIVGKRVETVVPVSRFGFLLREKVDYQEEPVPYGGRTFILNKRQLYRGDNYIGSLVTFYGKERHAPAGAVQPGTQSGHVARYNFSDIRGGSKLLHTAIERARQYAAVDSNILIMAETGAGKELFAQSIHNCSLRREKPFVAVNCAALPASLLESELFGYVEGAFTGAKKGGKSGVFEAAHGGTLFLDEVSEIPLELQGRLLRVIQEREVVRLGDSRVIPIDIRIICASNKPLLEQVSKGEFRRDLYYRINVLALRIPNLASRGRDVLVLADYFLQQYCDRYQKEKMELLPSAQEAILQHPWRGNVRELMNACECLAALSESRAAIDDAMVRSILDVDLLESDNSSDLKIKMERYEREQIQELLDKNDGNKTLTAKQLGISRTTFWRKLREYDLDK